MGRWLSYGPALFAVVVVAAGAACQQYRGSYAAGEFALLGDAGTTALVLYDVAEYSCPPGQGVESSTCDENRKRSLVRLDVATGAAPEVARLTGGHRLVGVSASGEAILLHSGETYSPLPGHVDWRSDRVDWIDQSGALVGRVNLGAIARLAAVPSADGRAVFLYGEGPVSFGGATQERLAVIADRDSARAYEVALTGRLVGAWWGAWRTGASSALVLAVGDGSGALVKVPVVDGQPGAAVTLATLQEIDRLGTLSASQDPRGAEIVADRDVAAIAYVTSETTSSPARLRVVRPEDGGVVATFDGPTRVSFSQGGDRIVATTPVRGDAGASVTVVRVADLQANTFASTLAVPLARITAGVTGQDDALVVVVDADALREKVLYGTEVGRGTLVTRLSGAPVATVPGTTVDRFAVRVADGAGRLVFFQGSTLRALDMASGVVTDALAAFGPASIAAIPGADLLSFRVERAPAEPGAFQQYGVFARLAADAGGSYETAWRSELTRTAD